MLARIYDEMVESVDHLTKEEQAEVIYAYVRYQLYWEIPETTSVAYNFFRAKKLDLDSCVRDVLSSINNGKTGWRTKKTFKNLNEPKHILKKPKHILNEPENRDKRIEIENKDNNKKEIIKKKVTYTDDFEKFWNEYPKKKWKQRAFDAWVKVISWWYEVNTIIQKAKDYATECKLKHVEEQYIKRPQWRLNDWRYDDDFYTWAKAEDKEDKSYLDKLY